MATIGPIGLSGGLNTKSSGITLPNGQLTDVRNVFYQYGSMLKRNGSVVLGSAMSGTPAIHGLTSFYISGTHYMMRTGGTAVETMNDLDGTWDDITGAITITSGQDNIHTFAMLNDIMAFGNGTDNVHAWNGSGNATDLAGSPPTGGILKTVNNFMFISGISTDRSAVRWSAVRDPETWSANNIVRFRSGDGDDVTALGVDGTDLLIFKMRSIGKLITTPISSDSLALGPLLTLYEGVGCAGKRALAQVFDGSTIFLGNDAHVYRFDGQDVIDIGDPNPPLGSIQPTLDALPPARLQFAQMEYYPLRNQVWLAVSTGSSTTNDQVYVYDLTNNAWTIYDNIAANALVSTIDPRSSPQRATILFSGNYGGNVYEQDRGSVNAEETNTDIDGYGTTSINLSAQPQDFIPRTLLIPVDNSGDYNLEVGYGFDGLSGTSRVLNVNLSEGAVLDAFVLDTDQLGGASELRRLAYVLSRGRARSMQIQFRNRLGSQPFAVHPFWISDEVIA